MQQSPSSDANSMMQLLQRDFLYNLSLLRERDAELERYDLEVVVLREELEKRGLDTKGKKPELMERLAIGIEDQAQAAREMALQAIKDAKAEFAKKKPEDLKDELEKLHSCLVLVTAFGQGWSGSVKIDRVRIGFVWTSLVWSSSLRTVCWVV